MTDPGYPGASTPDPNAQPAPGVPGQYPPPPAGGPGYGPPMPQGPFTPPPPPPGYASADDKTWSLVATFGAAAGAFISFGVLGFVGPLISYMSKGPTSPTVRQYAVASLNFQIPLSALAFIVSIIRVCAFSSFTGAGLALDGLFWVIGLAIWAVAVAFGIIAGLRANEGQPYKYPFGVSIIK